MLERLNAKSCSRKQVAATTMVVMAAATKVLHRVAATMDLAVVVLVATMLDLEVAALRVGVVVTRRR